MSDHEFFDLVFAMFFSFVFLTFVFVLFRGDEDGWWLCPGSVIWSENLESGFLIENLGYLVLALFCWMHILIQHDLFYIDVASKG
jgi:hypothetical protein